MTTELSTIQRANDLALPLTASDIRAQVNLVQEVMEAVMTDGEHYGKVPGCGDKPTLLQPGAQKLIMTFRLVPDPDMTVIPMDKGHREVRCKVKLYNQRGIFLGAGVGTCSTMEGKFRFRTGPVEFTDKPVPREYWDLRDKDPKKAKAMLGGDGFVPKKNDEGRWVCARQGEKVEHDNPADYYNTVEKMAFKRALVSATLTVTAASDIFTQDIEDLPEGTVNRQSTAKDQKTQPAQDKGASVLNKLQCNGEGAAQAARGQEDGAAAQTTSETSSQQGSDAPAPLSFRDAVNRLAMAETVKEVADTMNAAMEQDFDADQRKTIQDTKDEAMKRLNPKKK